MRKIITILSWGWLIIWVLVGASILMQTPEIISKRESQIEIWFKPSIDFVEHFRMTNNRLPDKREFNKWLYQGKILPTQPNTFLEDFKRTNNRNPTEQEGNEWESNQMKVIYTNKQLDSISKSDGELFLIRSNRDAPKKYRYKNINWAIEYVLGSTDEDAETVFYYQSWDRKNTYSWSWSEGFYVLISFSLIGICPLLFKGIQSMLKLKFGNPPKEANLTF